MTPITPTKQRNIIIAVVIAAFIIYFGYENCWFGCGNAVIDLQWCPERCCIDAVNDSDSNSTAPTDTCPPLDSKLRASNVGPYIIAGEAACRGDGYDWIETSTQVACTGDMGLDCAAAFMSEDFRKFAVTCRNQGGNFLCQDNYLGCYCPGSGTTIPGPTVCSKRVVYEVNVPLVLECAGPCETFQGGPTVECRDVQGTCMCDYPAL